MRSLLFVFSLCLLVSCASSSQAKPKSADIEKELRQNSTEFTEHHPQMAGAAFQSKSISKPSIMVVPEIAKNIHESIQILDQDPYAKAAANAINRYLTEKRFLVKATEGSAKIDEVVTLQSEIAGQDEDLSYIASLSFGADVYIKYSTSIRHGQILANLSAYESTSGRLLGSQSSTVNDNGTRKEELIASAVHKALPSLLKTVQAYWDEDSQIGVPYKIILRFTGEFNDLDGAHARVSTLLKQQFVKINTNAMTDRTADYTVYARLHEFGDAYEVYNALRATLGSSFNVKKNALVQKLLIVEIQP